MNKKERSLKEFEVFVEKIRDLGLEHGNLAEWYVAFGAPRLAEAERRTQRFCLDLALELERKCFGSLKRCCAYIRIKEQELFEKFKYYEERQVPFPAFEELENLWLLRKAWTSQLLRRNLK